jgi:phosphohistidine phosphatase
VDPQRGLSEAGRVEITRLANFVKPLSLQPAEVWHSGKARAEQTAQLLSTSLTGSPVMMQRLGLNPNDSPTNIAGDVEAVGRDLMLVGHLPFMSLLSSYFLAQGGPPEVLTFRTGTMACLKKAGSDGWHLEWMIHPGLLPGAGA